jgi:hypothetical protein
MCIARKHGTMLATSVADTISAVAAASAISRSPGAFLILREFLYRDRGATS